MERSDDQAFSSVVPAELRELLRGHSLGLRRPVLGRRHGRHRSARAGMGLDFRDHRAYAPGDDPRMLDWRAVARRDRLVLRQTEAEDELTVVLLLDLGGNMAYGQGGQTKAAVAKAVAGGLAWLALRQVDPVGIAIGRADEVDASMLRPSTGHERWLALGQALGGTSPSGRCPWPRLLGEVAGRLPRRSLVVALSDFLDPSEPDETPEDAEQRLLHGLAHLRARGHDVVLVQVLHRDEVEFPWTDRRMLKFLDLRKLRPEAEGAGASLREGYLERMRAHQRWLESQCEREGLFLERIVTDASLSHAFMGLLARLAGEAALGRQEPAR